jgi:hypothetical protein
MIGASRNSGEQSKPFQRHFFAVDKSEALLFTLVEFFERILDNVR